MERCVVAFAPGHISGFFKRMNGPSVDRTGSLGAGIVMGKGVRVTMKPADEISVSVRTGESPEFLTEALQKLGVSAEAYVDAELPIGAGFGMSAAGLLAAAHAANRLFDLKMSDRDITRFAHAFEVEHETGLGDAVASSGGGIDVRTRPGLDGVTTRITSRDLICAVSMGPIETPSVITSQEKMNQVSSAFPPRMPESLSDLFALSRSFSENSGLVTPSVRRVLDSCDEAGVMASMTMLGEGVFAAGEHASDVLKKFGTVYEFPVAGIGPYIIEEK